MNLEVTFYSKDGVPFNDSLAVVNTYLDGDVYHSANSEYLTCAKKEADGTREKFYIKKCTTGHNGGHFANPYGPLSNPKDLVAYDTMSARRHYEYTPVNEDIFNLYINFLVSRNPSYLRNAERDYNNTPKETYTHASR